MTLKEQALQFQLWLDDVNYQDWGFEIREKEGCLFLQITFLAADNDKPGSKIDIQRGRKWLLSQHMTKSEFIQTCLKAVLTAEEHEIRERFTYKGEAIFGPHFDVDELYRIATDEKTDIRTDHSKQQTNAKD